MTRLIIRPETRYEYGQAVEFGQHRLLLRPRDSHAVRIIDAKLTLSQRGVTRWAYDALGNCVCYWTPGTADTVLSIISDLVIERFPAPLSSIELGNPQTITPIVYGREDRRVLAPFLEPSEEDDGAVLHWLRGHLGSRDEPALDFLMRFTGEICQELTYQSRDAEGVQTPAQTLSARSGSCRDYAWLMVEALRRLGFAARFVTGYLHAPDASGIRGAGATHAWCEVFLPDLGWMEFDPTNGLAESVALIAVASARTPDRAAPVSGAIFGAPGYSRLFVSVDVSLDPAETL